MPWHSCPLFFAAGFQCTISMSVSTYSSAFGDVPRQMLRIIQPFGQTMQMSSSGWIHSHAPVAKTKGQECCLTLTITRSKSSLGYNNNWTYKILQNQYSSVPWLDSNTRKPNSLRQGDTNELSSWFSVRLLSLVTSPRCMKCNSARHCVWLRKCAQYCQSHFWRLTTF